MKFTNTYFLSINNIALNDFDNDDIKNTFKSGGQLLLNASKKAKVKDGFQSFYFEPTATIISFIESEKTKSRYGLLYDLYTGKILFYSSIRNWENLKNLDDKYWAELIEACKKCNIRFSADSGPIYNKDKTPEFNANFKSIVFTMMSVYVTAMLEEKKDRENFAFGQLEVSWNLGTICIADFETELNLAFKVFYKLNYHLWKTEDIRRQNKINRNKKSGENNCK